MLSAILPLAYNMAGTVSFYLSVYNQTYYRIQGHMTFTNRFSTVTEIKQQLVWGDGRATRNTRCLKFGSAVGVMNNGRELEIG